MQKSRTCSKCGHVGPIKTDFGTFETFKDGRMQTRYQAQCYWCRGRKTPRATGVVTSTLPVDCPPPIFSVSNSDSADAKLMFESTRFGVKHDEAWRRVLSGEPLPLVRDELVMIYEYAYPNDKAGKHRSVKFMTTKLEKRISNDRDKRTRAERRFPKWVGTGTATTGSEPN